MTHFTVLVCADGPDDVERLLAPYDENLDVAPYRSYEEGSPADYWLYKSYKEDWEKALKTPEGQDKELEARARVFLKLADPPTWEEIAWLVNSSREGDDDEKLLVDKDFPGGSARAYTMSTYNPESRWDWYAIGGRWGGSFRYKAGCAEQVLNADRGPAASWEAPQITPLHCDGGPVRALDIQATREEAADEVRRNLEKWTALTAGLPAAKSWAQHREMTETVPGYTIDQARADYHAQPVVQALRKTDFEWMDDPIARFSRPLADLQEEARAQAVLGYALVRRDGTWLAPGEMGWFAASSDNEASRALYREAANAYIDALPEDAWLIMVDCHI